MRPARSAGGTSPPPAPRSARPATGPAAARLAAATRLGAISEPHTPAIEYGHLKKVGILQDQENPHPHDSFGNRHIVDATLRRLQCRRFCLLHSILNRWRWIFSRPGRRLLPRSPHDVATGT